MDEHEHGIDWSPVETSFCYIFTFLHQTKLYFIDLISVAT